MDCPVVRELLAEHVLGTLEEDRRVFVVRHVEWCAGCRKEMAEMAEGAAGVVTALAPAEPPADLEDRVVGAIKQAAGRGRQGGSPRLGFVAAGVAALLAIGAIAWAMSMTGRVAELRDAVVSAEDLAVQFGTSQREAGEGRILSARLVRVGAAVGWGRGMLWDSSEGDDWVLVITRGLLVENGPYRAYVTDGGYPQRVGQLSPASPGETVVYRIFPDDMSGARWFSVRDRLGTMVLRGRVNAARG